jgi:hypothetical protein
MNIEYEFMVNIIDRIVQAKRDLNDEDYIDAAFDLGIIHNMISGQLRIYEASVEENEEGCS